MKQYRWTLIGLGISLAVLVITLAAGIDFFEMIVEMLIRFEAFELDEMIVPVAIFVVFAAVDVRIRHRAQRIEGEKVIIYRAMLSSTHHILNNFLNQVQLLKIAAEETPEFDPEILSLYGRTVEEATRQIEALGNITEISEATIQASVAPRTRTGD